MDSRVKVNMAYWAHSRQVNELAQGTTLLMLSTHVSIEVLLASKRSGSRTTQAALQMNLGALELSKFPRTHLVPVT